MSDLLSVLELNGLIVTIHLSQMAERSIYSIVSLPKLLLLAVILHMWSNDTQYLSMCCRFDKSLLSLKMKETWLSVSR